MSKSKIGKPKPEIGINDRMSDWIRKHSGHTIIVTHKILNSKATGAREFERFLCECNNCNNLDMFQYMAGSPRDKNPTCKECVE